MFCIFFSKKVGKKERKKESEREREKESATLRIVLLKDARAFIITVTMCVRAYCEEERYRGEKSSF